MLTKRLLGLSYLWTGEVSGIQSQVWATRLLYALLVELADDIAKVRNLPLARISLEMVFRRALSLHHGPCPRRNRRSHCLPRGSGGPGSGTAAPSALSRRSDHWRSPLRPLAPLDMPGLILNLKPFASHPTRFGWTLGPRYLQGTLLGSALGTWSPSVLGAMPGQGPGRLMPAPNASALTNCLLVKPIR